MSERRLAIVGDIHGQVARLRDALALVTEPVELLVLTGDLSLDPAPRRLGSVAEVLDAATSALGCPVVYVPGNHDVSAPPRHATAVNVDGDRVAIAGWTIAGLGGAGPAQFGFPYEWDEATAARRIERLAGGPLDVWLSHTPPLDTPLDRMAGDEHVGSDAVRNGLAGLRPKLFVCGHIHEAHGATVVDGVRAINAGSIGEPYAQTIAWVVGWDDGPVWIESRRATSTGEIVERHL